jgi:hypothetical protein
LYKNTQSAIKKHSVTKIQFQKNSMLSQSEKQKRRFSSYGMLAASTAFYYLKGFEYFNAPVYSVFFNLSAAYYLTGTTDNWACVYNSAGGNATPHQTREEAFGKEYVAAKRFEYNLMLLKGASMSLAFTAFLVQLFPPSRSSSSPQNCIHNAEFWTRAIGYLILQSVAMTIGGMINNPTLT